MSDPRNIERQLEDLAEAAAGNHAWIGLTNRGRAICSERVPDLAEIIRLARSGVATEARIRSFA